MSTEKERAAQDETASDSDTRDARAHEEEDGRPPEATNRVQGD